MATLFQKVRLLRGLMKGDIAQTGPFYVDVDVTSRCNMRCVGCMYHSPELRGSLPYKMPPTDIPLDLFRRICTELKSMNTHSMILTGMGEPFIHPDLSEIVHIAKAMNFHVTLFTNGTMMTSKAIDALIDAGVDVLRVSLWVGTTEQYRKNYPGSDPGNFTKVVRGLERLSNRKSQRRSVLPFLKLHHIINRHNFSTIDAIIDLANQTGCNGISFAPMHTIHGKSSSSALSTNEENLTRQFLLASKEMLTSLFLDHNIDEFIERLNEGGNVWETRPCYIAWIYSRIGADGTVFPCCRCLMTAGNLQEYPFREIWNGPALRAFRRRTRTREGLHSMQGKCNCNYCSSIFDNMRVHRYFRWFSPF